MAKVFISYVRENIDAVNLLAEELKKHGIKVWLDRNEIRPGSHWQDVIREAISSGDFFIACFSKEYNEKNETYMNEEITLAIERLRKLPRKRSWFIPVLFSGEVPNRNIGGGETLHDIQWIELSEANWKDGIRKILELISRKAVGETTHLGSTALAKAVEKVPRDHISEYLRQHGVIEDIRIPEIKILGQPEFYSKSLEESGCLSLRSTAISNLSREEAMYMTLFTLHGIEKAIAHDANKTYNTRYIKKRIEKDEIVVDSKTNLVWQRSGAGGDYSLTYQQAQAYINELNENKFAGHSHWRLPTLEEAVSLMEPQDYEAVYIDPIFDIDQPWIWTCDRYNSSSVWIVSYLSQSCYLVRITNTYGCVRAVYSES